MRRQIILQRRIVKQHALEPVVCSQLANRHQHCARRVRPHAFPEAGDAFFAGHAEEAVDGVLVAAALFFGQRGIVLHAYVENVARVSCHAAEEPGDGGHADEGQEGGFLFCRCHAVFERFVDAEAGHAVGCLTELGGG